MRVIDRDRGIGMARMLDEPVASVVGREATLGAAPAAVDNADDVAVPSRLAER
jgi:hypothetical protein